MVDASLAAAASDRGVSVGLCVSETVDQPRCQITKGISYFWFRVLWACPGAVTPQCIPIIPLNAHRQEIWKVYDNSKIQNNFHKFAIALLWKRKKDQGFFSLVSCFFKWDFHLCTITEPNTWCSLYIYFCFVFFVLLAWGTYQVMNRWPHVFRANWGLTVLLIIICTHEVRNVEYLLKKVKHLFSIENLSL